jgi:hypothetical protein
MDGYCLESLWFWIAFFFFTDCSVLLLACVDFIRDGSKGVWTGAQ